MSSARYRSYMRLLEKWPLNPSRSDRDLGQLLRRRIGETFSKGPVSAVANEAECDKHLDSLQKLSNDSHRSKWERQRITSATGHKLEDLIETLSDEGLTALAKEGGLDGFKKRVKENISSLAPKSVTPKTGSVS